MKNILKTELIQLIMDYDFNFIGFETVKPGHNLDNKNFKIKLLSNVTIVHELEFNSHLKLIEYKIVGDHSKLTESSGSQAYKVIAWAKSIRRGNGLQD